MTKNSDDGNKRFPLARRFLAVGIAAMLSSAVNAQELEVLGEQDGWELSRIFDFCSASTVYGERGEVSLMYMVHGDGRIELGVGNLAWDGKSGGRYEVVALMDGERRYGGPDGKGLTNGYTQQMDESFREDFASGEYIEIVVDGVSLGKYSLFGVKGATHAVHDCSSKFEAAKLKVFKAIEEAK